MTTDAPIPLTPAERSALKGEARDLEDHARIGKRGLEPSVIQHLRGLFEETPLLKIRLEKSVARAAPVIIEELVKSLNCQLVQHVGRVVVIYRAKVSLKR